MAGGVHRPGNRQVFFGKGLSLGCIVNGINGGQIGYHGTHVKGDSGRRNRAPRNVADHDLFIAGRVEVLHLIKLDRTVKFCNGSFQCGNLFRVCFFQYYITFYPPVPYLRSYRRP